MSDALKVERDAPHATITLNRPAKRNALTADLLRNLKEVVTDLDASEEVRAVIVKGAGKDFCAGADIHEMQEMDAAGAVHLSETAGAITKVLETGNIASVAAIHRNCLGGGLELALACDFRVCAENATFGQPEVRLGLIPGFGGTARLPRTIGLGRAKELILTGKTIDAKEAARIGLVHRVADDVEDAARNVAAEALEGGPLAYYTAKELLSRTFDVPVEEELVRERKHFREIFGSDDREEGINAFLEERDPEFTGE